MKPNTKKYISYTLKVIASVIAVANISCAIHSLHTGHTQIFKFSINRGNFTEFETVEDDFKGTNFSGAVAVLVTNILLTIGVFAHIDLFSYIWLFVYGSFWLVATFIAPDTYSKLPGICHVLATIISKEHKLDDYYHPVIYTCLKSGSCLIITLLLVLRQKNSQSDASSQTFIMGPRVGHRGRPLKISNSGRMGAKRAIRTKPPRIPALREEQPDIYATPNLGRSLATVSSSCNETLMDSTDTLVTEMTSTPGLVNLSLQKKNHFKYMQSDMVNLSNQSEECSFDVLRNSV